MSVLLTLVVCSLTAQARTPSWFTPSERVMERWSVIYSVADPLRFELVPKDAPNSAVSYEVLLVFPKPSSAYDIAIERVAEQFLARGLAVTFTAVNFEGSREKWEALLQEINRKEYDLIFSIGSVSTQFFTESTRRINTPVVSVTSKDPVLLGHVRDYESGSGTAIAYTSLDVPVNVQLAYLHELRPNLINIGVMYARNNTSAYEAQVLPLKETAENAINGINVIDVSVEDQGNAAAELREKIPQALRLMRANDPRLDNSIFWITGSTSVFKEITTINAHAQAVPVISLVTDVVREGRDSAVMSIGIGFSSNADLAAFYAIDILTTGVDPGTLPVGIVSPPDIAINFLVARAIQMKIPFSFFESSTTIYGPDGTLRRKSGVLVSN